MLKNIFKKEKAIKGKKTTKDKSKSKTSSNTLTDSQLNTIASTNFDKVDEHYRAPTKKQGLIERLTHTKNPFSSISKKVSEDKEFLTTDNTADFQESITGLTKESGSKRKSRSAQSTPSLSHVSDDLTASEKEQLKQAAKKDSHSIFNKNSDFLDGMTENATRSHTHSYSRSADMVTRSHEFYADGTPFKSNIEQKKLPIVGRLPIKQQYQLSAVVASLSVLAIISGVVMYSDANSRKNNVLQLAGQISAEIQKNNFYFNQALNNKAEALNSLNTINSQTENNFNELKKMNVFLENQENYINIQQNIDINLVELKKNLALLNNIAQTLGNTNILAKNFETNVQGFALNINKIFGIYQQNAITPEESIMLEAMKTNLQTMNADLLNIMLGADFNAAKFNELNANRLAVRNNLMLLRNGSATQHIRSLDVNNTQAVAVFNQMAGIWQKLSYQVDAVMTKAAQIRDLKNITQQNENIVSALTKDFDTLLNIYKNKDITGFWRAYVLLGLGVLALLLTLFMTFHIYSYEKDNRSFFEKMENNKNNISILRLVDELTPLQDGDLTKKTTVTEEITGAIADSVNATISSLASLVRKINDSSMNVQNKLENVNTISKEMLRSSELQAKDLSITGSAVIEISDAINEISSRTSTGAQEALTSVRVSEGGAKQVNDSVMSMQEINHHMNITVNLMQKVANSSQQISEIVDLLQEITEETSVLASNAKVQAAKAGDEGKGFKVVADSIQSLADKAGDAARRVGALINTVQTDVNAVEESIQKTNEQVDNGVKLSEAAGKSLNEMTQVSHHLSEVVQAISEEARDHALNAKKISESMKKILKTTENNKRSTEEVVSALDEISSIAKELGSSVQSFKID